MRIKWIYAVVSLAAMLQPAHMDADINAQGGAHFPGIAGSVPSTPIVWEGSAHMVSSTEGIAAVTVKLEPGWHLYGMRMPQGGPQPTQISFEFPSGMEADGRLTVNRATTRKYDDMFGTELEYWDGGEIRFTRRFRLTEGTLPCRIKCVVRFMGCDDRTCLQPQTKELYITVKQTK